MALGKKTAPVSHDILREKKQQVEALERQAEDAVEIVTRTVNRLELINQQIDDHMAEIDAYSEDLAKTREELAKQRKYNAAISANFSKLLDVDSIEGNEDTQGTEG